MQNACTFVMQPALGITACFCALHPGFSLNGGTTESCGGTDAEDDNADQRTCVHQK